VVVSNGKITMELKAESGVKARRIGELESMLAAEKVGRD
jgi:hypothetical protein